MSDDFGRGYAGDDPFVDGDDPEAVARAERRREREAKRASKRGRKAPKEAAPAPPPPEATPPSAPRTPEQEFWDEPAEPAPPTPAPPVSGQGSGELPKADPVKAKAGRRRLLGRLRGKDDPAVRSAATIGVPVEDGGREGDDDRGSESGSGAPAGSAASPGAVAESAAGSTTSPGAAEAESASDAGAPSTAASPAAKAPPTGPGESPTGEQSAAKLPDAQTGEAAAIEPAGPPTTEQPMPRQPEQPDDQRSPAPTAPPTTKSRLPGENQTSDPTGPPTAESRLPGARPLDPNGPPTAERSLTSDEPRPAGSAVRPTAESPRADPGPETAESPRPDPNRPVAAASGPGDAGPSTREHRAPVPIPVEQTGAGDWEPPPPRDDDWFDTGEEDFHEDGDPTMAGAARTGRRHGDDGGNRGILRRIFGHPFLIVAALIVIFLLILANGLFQPFHGDGHGRVAVVIPKGSSVGEVGDLLEKRGVISGGTLFVSGSTMFQARVTLAGQRSDLLSGHYSMQQDMSYGDAIDELTAEPKPAAQTAKPGALTVTIPEGQSRPITAKLLREDGIKGNYLKATKSSKLLNPEAYGGKNVKSLEGFLFPDTWDYNTRKPVKDLVALQLQDFKKKIKRVNMKYARSKNLTVFDVVTIASMIEREAGVPKQRKLVASVIYNRLHDGMTLGIDSTIRFATGNYEKPLTESELESESPYNTRTHAGLPPGPINSPGLAALNAAAHPAKTDYLFYVNDPNSCNELTFATNEEEFLADAQKYETAREKNGGNQPSTCK